MIFSSGISSMNSWLPHSDFGELAREVSKGWA